MNINIHPALVHFPIALLTVYALLELFRFGLLTKQIWYKPVKYVLLFIGTLFGFMTAQTGEIAEHLMHNRSSLVGIHSQMTSLTLWIFSILSIGYVIPLILEIPFVQNYIQKYRTSLEPLSKILTKIATIIIHISPLLAIIGLCTLTITGALGGAIVYGPNVDPVVSFIYKLFVK